MMFFYRYLFTKTHLPCLTSTTANDLPIFRSRCVYLLISDLLNKKTNAKSKPVVFDAIFHLGTTGFFVLLLLLLLNSIHTTINVCRFLHLCQIMYTRGNNTREHCYFYNTFLKTIHYLIHHVAIYDNFQHNYTNHGTKVYKHQHHSIYLHNEHRNKHGINEISYKEYGNHLALSLINDINCLVAQHTLIKVMLLDNKLTFLSSTSG